MGGKNSKTHGHVDSDAWRPKSKQWKRKNKAKARVSADARHSAIAEALKEGR